MAEGLPALGWAARRLRSPPPLKLLKKPSEGRRCDDQGALLRDLPRRPPRHQERVGQRPVPHRPRARGRGRRHRRRQRRQELQGRRDGWRGVLPRLLPHVRQLQQGVREPYLTLVLTSNGVDRDGATTQGGFSDVLVVNQDYAVYSPMVLYGLSAPGRHLGVVGLGGLGHVAVKFGKAFGMTVTVISSSPRKREETLERLGADAFLGSPGPRANEGGGGHDGWHHRHGVGGAPNRAAAGAAEADGADGGGGRTEHAAGAAGLRHHLGWQTPGRERRGQRR